MKTLYHMFWVNDYKGGELQSSINLTEEEAIERMYIYYNIIDYIYKMLDSEHVEQDAANLSDDDLQSYITMFEEDEDVFGTYAGGDSGMTFPEIYTISEGQLIRKYPSDEAVLKRIRQELTDRLNGRV